MNLYQLRKKLRPGTKVRIKDNLHLPFSQTKFKDLDLIVEKIDYGMFRKDKIYAYLRFGETGARTRIIPDKLFLIELEK